MNEMKHTPGPWHVGDSGPFLICTLTQKVKVYADEMVHTDATTDARLIAAAPELLEACRMIADSGMRNAAYDACVAAIAKATGEQP